MVFWSLFMAYCYPSQIGQGIRPLQHMVREPQESNIGPFCIPLVHVESPEDWSIGSVSRFVSRNDGWSNGVVSASLFGRYHLSKIVRTSHDNNSAFLSCSQGVKDSVPGSLWFIYQSVRPLPSTPWFNSTLDHGDG